MGARRQNGKVPRAAVRADRRPPWVRSSPHDRASRAANIGRFGYWSWDPDRGSAFLSDELLDILGERRGNTSGAAVDLAAYVHPDDRDDFEKALRGAAAGARLDITYRAVTADGRDRIVRSVAEPRSVVDGAPREIAGITFDVTERERVAEALAESESTLNAIVNSTTAMIYIKDVEGKYLLINHHFESAFGVRNHELRGKTDHAYLPPDVAESVRANDQRVLDSGQPIEFEEVVPHQGADHIYISIKFPLRRTTGEIYAVCGISTDITARKRAEAELERTKRSLERLVDERTASLREANRRLEEEISERRETASRLQRLIDTAREGIWMIDDRGRTTFANPRMAEMLGCEPGDMLGRPMADFMPEERRGEAAVHFERWRAGLSEGHDFELLRRDGSTLWTLLSAGPILDEAGRPAGAVAMLTDITERKQSEEHRALLLRELDHRVKNALATVVAVSEMTMKGARDFQEFAAAFHGRIQAMARTHEALARAKWKEVSLDELASLVLAAFQAVDPSRFTIAGEGSLVSPQAITPLALILNELATNALKHGALSNDAGSVRLAWQGREAGGVGVAWTESGGPPIARDPVLGTGLQLIRGLVQYELGGSLDLSFAPGGLVCRIEVPAAEFD